MHKSWELKPFVKSPLNPILAPSGYDWEAKDVFNPAAWTDGSRVWLLYRAEDTAGIGAWNGTSRLGLAHSRDGLHFQRQPTPVMEPDEPWELPGGCEDPRLVRIGELFYLTYSAFDGATARLALATSTDLRAWQKHGLIFPDRGWTKSGAILEAPIGGKYWMYFGDTNIWAAYSTDLRHWSVIETPVLQPRSGHFDSQLVEPGPPPIITPDGILLLYNGADAEYAYACGQALFDKADPTRLIARSEAPFLSPSEELEFSGQVPNVIFIEGLVAFQDQWFIYFGMGDSGIGVATHQPS